MKHIDEQTLELLVLGERSARKKEKQIRRHIAVCAGCRGVFEEIKAYYGEVELEGNTPDSAVPQLTRRSLVRMRNELEPYFAGPESEVASYTEVTVPSIWRRLNRFRREKPAMFSFGIIVLAAVTVISLSYVFHANENPAYYYYDAAENKMNVYNSSNKLLWSLPSFGLKGFWEGEILSNVHRTIVTDLRTRGVDQVITTIPIGDESWPPGLKVVNSHGKIVRRFNFPHIKVAYNGVQYDAPFAPCFILKERMPDGKLNLFVTANNLRSPTLIARFDENLKVLGEYWHYGTLAPYLVSADESGKKLLILVGQDDVGDMSGNSHNFMAVLDPMKLVGNTECSATAGFGLKASPAELYYLRFPISDLRRATGRRCGVTLKKGLGDSVFYVEVKSDSIMTQSTPLSFGFDYVFNKEDMRVREVKFIMPTEQTYSKLKREGKVHGTFDEQYLENLKNGVRYWDGKEWVKKPTRIKHWPNERKSAEVRRQK